MADIWQSTDSSVHRPVVVTVSIQCPSWQMAQLLAWWLSSPTSYLDDHQSHSGDKLSGPISCFSPFIQIMFPSVTAPVSSSPMCSVTKTRPVVSKCKEPSPTPTQRGRTSLEQKNSVWTVHKWFWALFWMLMLHQFATTGRSLFLHDVWTIGSTVPSCFSSLLDSGWTPARIKVCGSYCRSSWFTG